MREESTVSVLFFEPRGVGRHVLEDGDAARLALRAHATAEVKAAARIDKIDRSDWPLEGDQFALRDIRENLIWNAVPLIESVSDACRKRDRGVGPEGSKRP